MAKIPITVAHGDGIGPEIMTATLRILEASGAPLEVETVEIGEKAYLRGNRAGIEPVSWESLLRTRVFLRAPITTPAGGGFQSLNVTARKKLGQYANVRPCVSYHPFIETRHPNMDVVVIRENEEDVYAGIEYRMSPEVAASVKIASRPGCEKIVCYAFEYARRHNRKKVACFMKDTVMKMTDGLFHQVFNEIGARYPDIQKDVWMVDVGAAKLADTPEAFDVIVMPNLYGDILSGVAAQIAGSVGLAGSADIGDRCATFEAMHGSAPRRAGQNLANPSGLLLGAVLMLVHIHLPDAAGLVHNAWLRTIEDGVHTYDVFTEGVSSRKVGTCEFAEAVIARLGQKPNRLKPVVYAAATPPPEPFAPSPRAPVKMELLGVDVFVYWPSRNAAELAAAIGKHAGSGIALQTIDNRGVKVWPAGDAWTFCTDSFRCRFLAEAPTGMGQIVALLQRLSDAGFDIVMTETLRNFDGQPGFTLVQGQ
jgi:isocitrate dehydrogenase